MVSWKKSNVFEEAEEIGLAFIDSLPDEDSNASAVLIAACGIAGSCTDKFMEDNSKIKSTCPGLWEYFESASGFFHEYAQAIAAIHEAATERRESN